MSLLEQSSASAAYEIKIGLMGITPGMSVAGAVLGFLGVMAWRIQEGRRAVTPKKILIPPMGMATGFSMFVVPAFRVPWTWALVAFAIGAVALAYPLIRTSRLAWDGDTVMMRRSPVFFIVVIVLAAVRFAAKQYFDKLMSLEQTAGLFFILAFGMILHWRVSMYLEYRRLVRARHSAQAIASQDREPTSVGGV